MALEYSYRLRGVQTHVELKNDVLCKLRLIIAQETSITLLGFYAERTPTIDKGCYQEMLYTKIHKAKCGLEISRDLVFWSKVIRYVH